MSSPLRDRAYPPTLANEETAAITRRRRAAQLDPEKPVVGFALSGGGIRSATFCLGLFQALARRQKIRHIDLLSTVSGGGYFGSFLGAAFSRPGASPESVERELADNHSWSVNWLRDNGRFLSPNGSGDNWFTAAVALRNWITLQLVLLTFTFVVLGLAVLVRADLNTATFSREFWPPLEEFFWNHAVAGLWISPWIVLPLLPIGLLMLPTGSLYWLTQSMLAMGLTRRLLGLVCARFRSLDDREFAVHAQNGLSRFFMLGFVGALLCTVLALIDSVGQTVYLNWSLHGFEFPALWTSLTGGGTLLFGFGTRIALNLERFLGPRRVRLPLSTVALGLALAWTFLVVLGLSVIAFGFAWEWGSVWDGFEFRPMFGTWQLMVAIAVCFGASWIASRSFGFVNLSSLQQLYTARIARAYLGATNPERQRHANYNMTELIPGDDLALDDYTPHAQGGPLHLINVTINETLSGKTQVERRDRKGLAMALGPSGLCVGIDSHALWSPDAPGRSGRSPLHALWEWRRRTIVPVVQPNGDATFHALCDHRETSAAGLHSVTETNVDAAPQPAPQRIEALALGRWIAISGAAFTTGTGSNTSVGLSLLLGLANVRLGYWWDSGIAPGHHTKAEKPNFLELGSRIVSWMLPVQSCLLTEFFARFHGPARRHWYLSDGGHFENTGCYELIRRRVPFIVCSDAGQDAAVELADFANLVRKVRTDFNAEIQLIRRAKDAITDDPGVRFPLPALEELVHPSLLDVIGTPDDFEPLTSPEAGSCRCPPRSRAHAVLARIHYRDTDAFSWLLLLKPSIMGDEATDVIQYQCVKKLFPHEPTTDQYFDEAQWESYRKLGEHIGIELFTAPTPAPADAPTWSPSDLRPPL
ncbi:MAG: patatin-like phospholipase family protein [Verrucomicrobiota bacterium]